MTNYIKLYYMMKYGKVYSWSILTQQEYNAVYNSLGPGTWWGTNNYMELLIKFIEKAIV